MYLILPLPGALRLGPGVLFLCQRPTRLPFLRLAIGYHVSLRFG